MTYWKYDKLFAQGGVVCFWQSIDDVEHGAFWALGETGWCAYAELGGEQLCNTGGNTLPDGDTLEYVAEAIIASGEYDKKLAAANEAERAKKLASGDYTTCPRCNEPMLWGDWYVGICEDCQLEVRFTKEGQDE